MIIYFSGTGNSRAVALELHRRFFPGDDSGKMLCELSGARLLYPDRQLLTAEDNELILWVFPIYSWGVPPMVNRFIDKVRYKNAENGRHYMVCTCGDDVGRADDQWRQHIGRRSWIPRGAFSVIMPNTYVCMKGFDVDPEDVAAGKIAAMPGRLDEICGAIGRGFADSDVTRGSWAWMKTNVVYPLFRAFKMSPLPFRADPATCTRCGLCARGCPTLNISLKKAESTETGASVPSGRGALNPPQWGPVCTMCLRCYHNCPVHAISYGKETDGKGQYRFPAE